MTSDLHPFPRPQPNLPSQQRHSWLNSRFSYFQASFIPLPLAYLSFCLAGPASPSEAYNTSPLQPFGCIPRIENKSTAFQPLARLSHPSLVNAAGAAGTSTQTDRRTEDSRNMAAQPRLRRRGAFRRFSPVNVGTVFARPVAPLFRADWTLV